MRFLLSAVRVSLGLAAVLFAAPALLPAWQTAGPRGDLKGPTPAPRVLTPQKAQPISPAAAQRNEPATVVIEDSSPPRSSVSGKATTRLSPSAPPPVAGGETPAAVPDREPVIEAARLKGIQPGTSTMSQVRASWGEPQKIDRYERHVEHTHRLEPFQQVIVAYQQDKVTAIVVHLQTPLKTEAVTAQLGLEDLEPALAHDAGGAILGQVFPERGVLFSFQPGATERLVAQIVLEPIYPQPFALRRKPAGDALDGRPEGCRASSQAPAANGPRSLAEVAITRRERSPSGGVGAGRRSRAARFGQRRVSPDACPALPCAGRVGAGHE